MSKLLPRRNESGNSNRSNENSALSEAERAWLRSPQAERYQRLLAVEIQKNKWRDNPADYFESRLQAYVWDDMRSVLNSVRDNRETAWRSANAVGKTFTLAGLVCYALDCFDEILVFTTGSSWSSLDQQLWPKIRSLISKNNLFPGASKLDLEIWITEELRAYAQSTNEGVNIQGAHGKNILQIIDESDGISEDIANAIYGNAKGAGSRIIWCGNPIATSGHFSDVFKRPKIVKFTTSAFDHPNVRLGEEVIPGAVTRQDVELDAERWCDPCSPDTLGAVHLYWCDLWYLPRGMFFPRVLGTPPMDEEDQFFPTELIERAMENYAFRFAEIAPEVLGVDVAVSSVGDETVIAGMNEAGIKLLDCARGFDTDETAGKILVFRGTYAFKTVAVDTIGLGRGVYDQIMAAAMPGIMFVASGAVRPENAKIFSNLKAEAYYDFLKRLRDDPRFALPNDPILKKQLQAVKKKYGSAGMSIEPKKKGESPDRAEACIIANYAFNNSVSSSAMFSQNKENRVLTESNMPVMPMRGNVMPFRK